MKSLLETEKRPRIRIALPSDAPNADLLDRAWREPSGLRGVLESTNHKTIGLRFIVTAFTFFALAGVAALVMRLQLASSGNDLLGADLYNQVFTLHGTTMMFLFAVPMIEGLGLYFVPLMIGTRNLALPRLAAYAYWVYLIAGLLLWGSFLLGMAPDAGWFSYVPLSGPEYSPGKRVDVWSQTVSLSELAGLTGAVNLITTILKLRAPGMSLGRMPLFVWSMLITSFMIVFAMPSVMMGSTVLSFDRLVGTHFFNPAEGGGALLWQHLFWFFGHPEVYIIFLPALGLVSTLVVAMSRRAVVGYPAIVLSMVTTGFVSFGLWVHHMFTTGIPELGASFFTAASMIIAIPTGIQIFCWIATLWTGRLRLETPLLYVLGFLFVFVIGGLSGVMLASVPLDTQVHDTFFVVAHFHYVLIGGMVFPLLGAIHYWLPKISGRRASERMGKLAFGLVFVGFNLTFFPMHVLGLHGMPRRVFTYRPDQGFDDLNLLATTGAFVLGLGVLVYFLNLLVALRSGERVADPWHADTLDWLTTSPPPAFNFARLPTVAGRYPRWTETNGQPPIVTGLDDSPDKRHVLVTRATDAAPDHREELPGPSWTPLLIAAGTGVTFIGLMFSPWFVLIGGAVIVLGLVFEGWPSGPHHELMEEQP